MDRGISHIKRYSSLFCHNEGIPLAFFIVVVAQLVALIWGDPSFPIGRAGEDGSFYIQIAHNLVILGYPTFDGIAPTTGVHWGWLFLLASVYKTAQVLFGSFQPEVFSYFQLDSPESLFRVAAVLYFLLLVGAGLVVVQISRSWALGLFLVVYLANKGHWYMETHLVLLTLALAIRYPGPLTGFLLVAARTDMVLFALFTREWKLFAGAILGFIWVCLVNIMVDGNPISISAQIKSAGFNDWETIIRTVGTLGKYYWPVLPITCFLAIFSYDRWFIAAICLLLIHIIHNSETQGWYLAPLFLTSLLCAYRIIHLAGLTIRFIWGYMGLSGVRG